MPSWTSSTRAFLNDSALSRHVASCLHRAFLHLPCAVLAALTCSLLSLLAKIANFLPHTRTRPVTPTRCMPHRHPRRAMLPATAPIAGRHAGLHYVASRTPHLHNLTLRRLCSDAIDSLLRRLLRLLAAVMCSVGGLAGAESGATSCGQYLSPLDKPTASPKLKPSIIRPPAETLDKRQNVSKSNHKRTL